MPVLTAGTCTLVELIMFRIVVKECILNYNGYKIQEKLTNIF
jgi:hypothetical protein